MISMIVAMDRNRVIGVAGKLPWHLPADLKRFKELTMGHHIVMGRKTFESIGKALPGRVNVIVTRQQGYHAPKDCLVMHSLEAALTCTHGDAEAFVIGGGELFLQALPFTDRIHVTEVDVAVTGGDAFFPKLEPARWQLSNRAEHEPDDKNRFRYTYLTYEKKR